MKIIELLSENFKRLNAHVVMDGKSVTVEGKNGVGKSSFIDAIWVALTGKDVPEQPIQQGKDSAKIAVTVKSDDGSQFIVERKFMPSGAGLTVKTNDGAKFSSPQKFLDQKLGCISFDPFEFIHKQPREQKKFLMELLGIDLTDIDQLKKTLLSQKDELTKQYQSLKSEIDKLPPIDEELEEKSTTEAINKFNEINIQRESIQKVKAHYENLKLEECKLRLKLENMKAEITELQAKHDEIAIERRNIIVKIDSYDPKSFVLPELSNLQEEIASINAHNERVKQQKIAKIKRDQIKVLEEKGMQTVRDIKVIESDRINIITSAKMPIEGLSFGEDGLLFEGLPFTEEQLSTAKLIEAGIKISMALNPNLRIMRIKDGSLLDSDTLAIIKKAAKDSDYQLFIERVSDNKEIGFVIEE
jgi:DNA repair exonuclease SbcCD ATPase subunit